MAKRDYVWCLVLAGMVFVLSDIRAGGLRRAKLDFNGDGKSELAIFDKGFWAAISYDDSYFRQKRLGSGDSIAIPGNYSNLGSGGFAGIMIGMNAGVYDTKNGIWTIQPMDESLWHSRAQFGYKGATPVPGDFDGDGLLDLAVYDKGVWSIMRSQRGFQSIKFGFQGGHPLVCDFDGDGIDNPVVVWEDKAKNAMRWAVYNSSKSIKTYDFGPLGSVPVPGDYTGDGKDDLAVWWVDSKTKQGAFYIWTPTADKNPTVLPLGVAGDTPVGGCDFDGDGKSDIAVYNEKNGRWTLGLSESHRTVFKSFGYSGAKAIGASSLSQSAAHLPIIEPKDFKGTLWKPVNHSGDGTVVLLAAGRYRPEYNARLWARCVVSSDPAGENVLPRGVARIEPPYADGRPTIRIDQLGKYFRPGPVYLVLIYKDGRRQPWLIPDPGSRVE